MNHKYIEEIMNIEESPYGWSKKIRVEMRCGQIKEEYMGLMKEKLGV